MTGTDGDDVVPRQSPWKTVALAAFVLACAAIAATLPLGELRSAAGIAHIRDELGEAGPVAPVIFFAAGALGVAVGVPRLLLAAVAGALFGWLEGAAIAQFASILGCWATFAVGRALGAGAVATFVARRFEKAARLLDLIGRHGFAANVLLRAAPVGNCFATNVLMSASPVGTGSFLLGTFLGTLPETVIFALFGSAAEAHTSLRLAVGGASLAVLAVATTVWVRRTRLVRGPAGT